MISEKPEYRNYDDVARKLWEWLTGNSELTDQEKQRGKRILRSGLARVASSFASNGISAMKIQDDWIPAWMRDQ